MASTTPTSIARPATAGVVSALVGFTSSFVVVLAGLQGVGADPGQAASGLFVASVLMGVACIALALWTRIPITIAWSTPGAALLVTSSTGAAGWPAAVGCFLVVGALIVLTGLVPQLGALIGRIPTSIAQAMLAGVVFQLCLGPVTGLASNPWEVAPVVIVWLLAMRFLPRWSSPLAFVTAAIVIAVHVARSMTGVTGSLVPRIELTAPTFDVTSMIGVALPLYLVTMASQNVPGVAVMKGFGYEVPWRRSMVVTGAGTMLGAPAGVHSINLAAISAALAAGDEAGEDRSRRWIASIFVGSVYIVLGLGATAFATLVHLAPPGVIAAVAGLALMGTFASSLKSALADADDLIAAAVTFITAASGIAIAGISSAFWALLAGIVVRSLLKQHRHS